MENNITNVFRTENQSIIAEGTIVKVNDDATLDDWKSFGEMLKRAENHVQWYLGFWWNYGHKKWSRDAEIFIKSLGYKRETLRTYGCVYKLVKPSRRLDGLSFTHHQDVAYLSPEKQENYLKKAEKERLSSPKLRAAIRAAERPFESRKEQVKKHYLTEKRLTALKEQVDKIVKLLNCKFDAHAPVKMIRFEFESLKAEIYKLDTYR